MPLGQCLLRADDKPMSVTENLWLDRLYIRLTSPKNGFMLEFVCADNSSELWMTEVTFQGNGDGEHDCVSCRLRSDGLVYAKGM